VALATSLNNLQGKELTMGLMDQLGQAVGGTLLKMFQGKIGG
jgi:hypothetical protein